MEDAVINNILRSQRVEDYLDFFESKNLEGVEEVLAPGCTLTDWNVDRIQGKTAVVRCFEEIFDSVNDIEVEILHIHEDLGGILICEMNLTLDGLTIPVADIFEFDEDNLIRNLRAYRGN